MSSERPSQTAPVIGLSTYGRDEKNRFTLYGQYVDGVRRAGGLAVLMPPGEAHLEQWVDTLDGLLLAGGGDMDPARYGGRPHQEVYHVDEERDSSEFRLAELLLAQPRLPALCICRGLQVLNVALGGTLIEHLPDEPRDPANAQVEHRLPPREPVPHEIELDADSLLAARMGATNFSAYSWHHQAIKRPAPGLAVVARAPDGVIEAVELRERPNLVAVQWHPELGAHEDALQQGLFDSFVEDARRYRRER